MKKEKKTVFSRKLRCLLIAFCVAAGIFGSISIVHAASDTTYSRVSEQYRRIGDAYVKRDGNYIYFQKRGTTKTLYAPTYSVVSNGKFVLYNYYNDTVLYRWNPANGRKTRIGNVKRYTIMTGGYDNRLFCNVDYGDYASLVNAYIYHMGTKKSYLIRRNSYFVTKQNEGSIMRYGYNVMLSASRGDPSPVPLYRYNMKNKTIKRIDSKHMVGYQSGAYMYYYAMVKDVYTPTVRFTYDIKRYNMKTGKLVRLKRITSDELGVDVTNKSCTYRLNGKTYRYTYATKRTTRVY